MSEINTKSIKYDTKKNLNPLPNYELIKFIIRTDLTAETRFQIAHEAYHAQQHKNYGAITKLTEKYKICRAFVYVLLKKLKSYILKFFSTKEQEQEISKKEIISRMLMQRMVGKSSIEAISELMKYDELKYSSVGSVSQSLSAIGALLPSVQAVPFDKIEKITVVSDEIFIGDIPILISLEPKSSFILNIEWGADRTKRIWLEHIARIESASNIDIVNMATDNGSGLRSAIGEKNIPWQPDTYHAIAHRLGKWVHILEQKAYKRIAIEYERKRIITSAKTTKIINARRYKYKKACKSTFEAIEIYEDFLYLYTHIIKELKPFHSNGKLRDRVDAKANIEVALELIKSLKNGQINTQIASIERILPELLNYFDEAKRAIQSCEKLGIDSETITTLSLAWQWNKSLIKAKKEERRKRARAEYLFYIEYAKDTLGDSFEEVRKAVFDEFDNIIQASSMVENINSILRPYLNQSKNQVTQKFLNLFAFYHNHRRYKAGKRKGKTPMEILTGERQDKDWVELLTDFIEMAEPSFFL